MKREICDYVCELMPNIWLANNPNIFEKVPLGGVCNVWDAMIKPKMYLEEKVKELCSQSMGWKEDLKRWQEKGYPKYHIAKMTLEIKKKDSKQSE